MSVRRHFVLAAGGTGGHMVPAHALAAELVARGHRVALITDDRGARIPGLFEGVEVHVMPAGRVQGGPLGWLKAIPRILEGRAMALRLYREFRPTAVIGFGGYPAFPAIVAAFATRIGKAIHEQNAVLGRVNRLVAGRVDLIATAYGNVQRLKPGWQKKVHLVGNPVREPVRAIGQRPYPPIDGVIRILVTGGSQGATILSEVVPAGLALLSPQERERLRVVQQCRPEDIEAVRGLYATLGIRADLASYFEDLPAQLDRAHLVIGRAGASTIAELTVAGRPSILVPLPSAMDDHQTANAAELAREGGAVAMPQSRFTPKDLAQQVTAFLSDPDALALAAAHAKACGHPDAARALADLMEGFGRPPVMDAIGDEVRGAAVVGGAVATARSILPGTGRGTMRSMVEGALYRGLTQRKAPSVTPAARHLPVPGRF